MIEKERDTKLSLGEEDEPVEWPDEVFERAQISVGGKVVREASGTFTRRGRPPVGDEPKQQVTLRLPRHVIEHFKAGGAGWQTRISEALERQATGTHQEQGRLSSVAESRSAYMSDDLKNRGPQDRSRVNVNEDWELRYWTREFGVTADQLRAAVRKVGVMRTDVERELKG
jgi:uncharacterized protein (DUF4415 family)